MYQSRTQTLTQTQPISRLAATTEFVPPSIQFDPRVRRGPALRESLERTQLAQAKSTEKKDRFSREAIKQRKEKLLSEGKIRPTKPSIADLHEKINSKLVIRRTEFPRHLYLEEREEPPKLKDSNEQCDEGDFLPEEPLEFLPEFAGDKSVGCQVDPAEIFNYDRDSQPLLEVLTSKIIDSALLEVREEEELIAIRHASDILKLKYELEQLKSNQLVESELKSTEMKERKMKIQQELYIKQWKLKNKLLAKEESHLYLYGLKEWILNNYESTINEEKQISLQEEWGIQSAIHNTILPEITNSTSSQLQLLSQSRSLLDYLTHRGLSNLSIQQSNELNEINHQKQLNLAQEKKLNQENELNRLKNKKIQLFINCESLLKQENGNNNNNSTNNNNSSSASSSSSAASVFGPFPLTGSSNFQEITRAVIQFFSPPEVNDDGEETDAEPPIPLEQLPFLWDRRIQFSMKNSSSTNENPNSAAAAVYHRSPSDEAAALAARASLSASRSSPDSIEISPDNLISLAELELHHGRVALSHIRLSLRPLSGEEVQLWENEKLRRKQEKEAEEEEEDEERE